MSELIHILLSFTKYGAIVAKEQGLEELTAPPEPTVADVEGAIAQHALDVMRHNWAELREDLVQNLLSAGYLHYDIEVKLADRAPLPLLGYVSSIVRIRRVDQNVYKLRLYIQKDLGTYGFGEPQGRMVKFELNVAHLNRSMELFNETVLAIHGENATPQQMGEILAGDYVEPTESAEEDGIGLKRRDRPWLQYRYFIESFLGYKMDAIVGDMMTVQPLIATLMYQFGSPIEEFSDDDARQTHLTQASIGFLLWHVYENYRNALLEMALDPNEALGILERRQAPNLFMFLKP